MSGRWLRPGDRVRAFDRNHPSFKHGVPGTVIRTPGPGQPRFVVMLDHLVDFDDGFGAWILADRENLILLEG